MGLRFVEKPYLCNMESQKVSQMDICGMSEMLKERPQDAHKGTMGHALLVAGSYGMAGCSTLAAEACLRSGVGKVTLHTTECNRTIVQTAVPEAILRLDATGNLLSHRLADTDGFQAVGIGPGIGLGAIPCLSEYLNALKQPAVLDADALTLLAQNPVLMQPKGWILTPHPGEMQRLAEGFHLQGENLLQKAMEMASQYRCIVVLKGHPTHICLPDGAHICCPRGNAGMATAGSGDVLTGLITGLLAQGYPPEQAAPMGVWLHATAGDYAAEEMGMECLLARDIIRYLPMAFRELRNVKQNNQ